MPYGTLPVAVKAESVKWKLDEDGGMLALRYAITIGGPAAAPFYAPMSSRTKNADARNITTSAQSAAGIV